MKKFKLYGQPTDSVTELELINRQISKEVATEGIVLLENDQTLPINTNEIAIFGVGSINTVKGGTGSGEVYERYSVNIYQGFINANIKVTNTTYLEDLQKHIDEVFQNYKTFIEQKLSVYPLDQIQKMQEEVVQKNNQPFPNDIKIQPNHLTNNDIAIYVLSRQAGEFADRALAEGDYLLDDVEIENIKTLSNHYNKVILVLNSGIVDISNIKVNAIVYMSYLGEEGGNALVDVLTGKVSPSGKLTTTWAKSYFDYPNSDLFGNLSNPLQQDYLEGIYVGYRFFDSFDVLPQYCFGYGLSYTDFLITTKAPTVNKNIVSINVNVKNVGKYSGKEVVQVYITKPYIYSEKHSLVAFSKTKLLKPNESTDMTITFDLLESFVYDEDTSNYILPQGTYSVSIGNSIQNLKDSFNILLEEKVIIEKCKPLCLNENPFEDLTPLSIPKINPNLPLIKTTIDVKPISHKYPTLKPIIKTPQTKKYLESLSDIDLIKLTVGGGYTGYSYNITPQMAGRTTSDLVSLGIPNVNFADGPAGLRLNPRNAYTSDGEFKFLDELPKDLRFEPIKTLKQNVLADGTEKYKVFQYLTAFPCSTLQAQTFNPELIIKVGQAVGKEMLTVGVTLWLAPGMNIHRNPLCGRNFEYYSEDPLIAGIFASSITNGVQSNDGVGVTIKHFCCNNQETQRQYMSSNVSERALREIYLKGFKYTITHSNPKALMTSYNKLNNIYTPNNYELCVDILRNEWNYQGLVMTDWESSGEDRAHHEMCHKCGNDLIEAGGDKVVDHMIKCYHNNQLDMNLIKVCAANVLNLIFESDVYKKQND